MRDVSLYTLMSLDGAVDDPGRYFPETDRPGAPVFDDVLAGLESEMIARQDAVLLGRNMYDEWSQYWPTSDEEPFASFINQVRKYVVTSTPLMTAWTNAEAVSSVADVVRDLKAQPGGEIGVHGSIRLAKSMLADGLIDVIHLAVGRVLDPVGRRLFDEVGDRQLRELVRAVPTPSGSLWLTYRVRPSGTAREGA